MEAYGLSDIGLVRETNQDSFFYGENGNGDFLAIVCDGIGGGKAGDVASSLAVDSIKKAFYEKPLTLSEIENKEWISKCINQANEVIYRDSLTSKHKYGMGTTLVGVLLSANVNYLFHMGDSRAYGIYDDIICLTEDHNLAADLIRSGELSEEEALKHPKGRALTNALGIWCDYRLDINKIRDDYHYLLLCSDGLHGYVEEKIIENVIRDEMMDLKTKVELLINKAIQSGGYDNITAIVMKGKRG